MTPPPLASPSPERLAALEDRLERIEALLERLERRTRTLDALEQTPAVLATVTDTVDGWVRDAQRRGIDPVERLPHLLKLAEEATRPGRLEALIQALDALEQAPAMAAMAVDAFDDVMRRFTDQGINPFDLLNTLSTTLTQLTRTLQSPEFQALMTSGVLDPKSVEIIARAGQALVEVRAEPPEEAGLFKTLFALRDPHLQRTTGFALAFGRRFGQLLRPALPR